MTMTGTKVVAALDRAARQYGYPQMITVDNGSEFASKILDARVRLAARCEAED